MIVALIRHPRPDIAPGLCYGRMDVGLHADGAVDLAPLGCWRPDVLWTSPSRRCRAVADRLAALWGLVARVDVRLLELDFGEWEGRPWDDVPREALDRWAALPLAFAPPGGETGAALLDRVFRFQATIDADCAIVSHGGPLKLLAAMLGGRLPDLLAPSPPLGSVQLLRTT